MFVFYRDRGDSSERDRGAAFDRDFCHCSLVFDRDGGVSFVRDSGA